jgi:hypothetical protein
LGSEYERILIRGTNHSLFHKSHLFRTSFGFPLKCIE